MIRFLAAWSLALCLLGVSQSSAQLQARSHARSHADDTPDKKSENDPKSNNTKAIKGKWKVDTLPGLGEAEQKVFKDLSVTLYFDFAADGTFAMGFESPNQMFIEALKQKFGSTRFLAKYRLLSGDDIELYDFQSGPLSEAFKSNKARSACKIDGEKMTMTDPDGKTGTLTRMKPPGKNPEKNSEK
jgi:hypothetical protein